MFSRRAACVLFNELMFTSRLYMRELTQISSEWLPELAPQFFGREKHEAHGQPAGMLRPVHAPY